MHKYLFRFGKRIPPENPRGKAQLIDRKPVCLELDEELPLSVMRENAWLYFADREQVDIEQAKAEYIISGGIVENEEET